MYNFTEILARTLAIGAGATLAMDVWRFFMRRAFGVNALDLGLLGRWVGHLPRGRILHHGIAQSPKIGGELALGWISHYAIGFAFAGLLPLIWGSEWLRSPTLLPALITGIATLLAPWLIMQPAMGLGFAAKNTPNPNAVRLRNTMIHTVYGIGLYTAALIVGKI
ncbi:MAG: DUF2938 domain-containing protein [Turneriella sp.]|nr:DUF2938 domain-containing protein [Turneriella sp.]